MDPRRERRELAAGAHIVVGTPGRLRDHLRARRLDVSELGDRARRGRRDARPRLSRGPGIHPGSHAGRSPHAAVLRDPAARHRRPGDDYQQRCPPRRHAQATRAAMPTSNIAPSGSRAGRGRARRRQSAALLRIAAARWSSATPAKPCGICKRRCCERGFSVVALSGELTQSERTHALQALRDGRARVCVATDVAARGIDLPEPRPRHPRRSAQRSGGAAASLRPHRPRRPQGRQRPSGAAGAPPPRRGDAEPGGHRYGLGHCAASRMKFASSIRSAC